MKWAKSPTGWISDNGAWRIRGPIMGKPMYWLYLYGARYTPTNNYEDCVHFSSVQSAKRFVSMLK